MDNETMVRALISLTDKQKDSLDLLARNICRKRKHHLGTEKVTTSMLFRCLANIFMERWNKLDLENIHTEKELLSRIRKVFSLPIFNNQG